jgi:hypothetical protein
LSGEEAGVEKSTFPTASPQNKTQPFSSLRIYGGMDSVPERREKRRFVLAHTIRFRLSARQPTSRWAVGTIQDMSSSGVSFRCRRPIPLGGHLELVVDWPASLGNHRLVSLHASGFVVRSSRTKAAVRITSHRFHIVDWPVDSSIQAIA